METKEEKLKEIQKVQAEMDKLQAELDRLNAKVKSNEKLSGFRTNILCFLIFLC